MMRTALAILLWSLVAQTRAADSEPACTNKPSNYMRKNGITCESWKNRFENNPNDTCKGGPRWWTNKKYCQQSCFDVGKGYDGDDCRRASTPCANLMPFKTHRDMNSWFKNRNPPRDAGEGDCTWMCGKSSVCECSHFSTSDEGTCTLFGEKVENTSEMVSSALSLADPEGEKLDKFQKWLDVYKKIESIAATKNDKYNTKISAGCTKNMGYTLEKNSHYESAKAAFDVAAAATWLGASVPIRKQWSHKAFICYETGSKGVTDDTWKGGDSEWGRLSPAAKGNQHGMHRRIIKMRFEQLKVCCWVDGKFLCELLKKCEIPHYQAWCYRDGTKHMWQKCSQWQGTSSVGDTMSSGDMAIISELLFQPIYPYCA